MTAMQIDEKMIAEIVKSVIASEEFVSDPENKPVPIGVSNRHVHVTQEDLEILFGKGAKLTVKKELMGDDFASNELVTIIGPSLRPIENVRILGPVRKHTQVEISRTDTFVLKVKPPVRPSGDVAGSASVTIVGPKGVVTIPEGCIIANRHIHMTPQDAAGYGLKDGDYVDVEVGGIRRTKFYDVQIRVNEKFRLEMHIDTDDANACGVKCNDLVTIVKKD